MSHKELSHLWKEAVASRPSPRDVVKTMYMSLFAQAVRHVPVEGMHQMQSVIQDFVLLEVKGRSDSLHAVNLPFAEGSVLWLCLQFQGKVVFPNGGSSKEDKLFSFVTEAVRYTITLAAGVQWLLFFGVSGTSRVQLLAELPDLREAYNNEETNMLKYVTISALERQAIASLFKLKYGPFSTLHHIGITLFKLFDHYTAQLDTPEVLSQEEFLIQMYHNALAYIHTNYLSGDLTREKIASELCYSTRALNRAFEGRSLGLMATVLTVRLYKGRELLRTRPELSMEQIAGMLHFFDAKHFAAQYKKCFNCSPREDRKERMEKINKIKRKKM